MSEAHSLQAQTPQGEGHMGWLLAGTRQDTCRPQWAGPFPRVHFIRPKPTGP